MASPLSDAEISEIVKKVSGHRDAGESELAWERATPLLERLEHEPGAASALAWLVSIRAFGVIRSLDVLRIALARHGDDDRILALLGQAVEGATEIQYLNAAPPDNATLRAIAERLSEKIRHPRGDALEFELLRGLATAGRLLGRAWDRETEDSHDRLVAIAPTRSEEHYNQGLFFKTRGRFAEGLASNRRAAALATPDESTLWNLGICATGTGDGAAALTAWKQLDQWLVVGRFGLPEGEYAPVKVRLAERPIAERGPETDNPGIEETIWVGRLSPCHGIVQSALYYDLGVDYGDVVLFDGAPVTHHTYGTQRVPVFPHLATLVRSGFRLFRFVATQPSDGAVAALSERLLKGAHLYVHTEQCVMLCSSCWERAGADRGAHRPQEHRVVRGKLCISPDLLLADVQRQLDQLVASAEGVRLLVPDLAFELGDTERAEVERRRANMVRSG